MRGIIRKTHAVCNGEAFGVERSLTALSCQGYRARRFDKVRQVMSPAVDFNEHVDLRLPPVGGGEAGPPSRIVRTMQS